MSDRSFRDGGTKEEKRHQTQTVWSSSHAMPLMIIFWSRFQGASGGNKPYWIFSRRKFLRVNARLPLTG